MNFPAAEKHLSKVDPVMKRLIKTLTLRPRNYDSDTWRALTSSIIGQQISVHAAAAVRGRFAALEEGRDYVSPEFVLGADDEVLRGSGLSRNKVLSIRDIAARLADGRLDPRAFPSMSDEDVIAALLPARGIGRWTAEVFLMFCLQREDVLAVDDLGLRNAMRIQYGQPELSAKEMLVIAEPWRPYRSVASLYLWQTMAKTPKIAD